MSVSSRPCIAVVTWFYDAQPGFLDFQYRVEALGRRFDVLLFLRHARFAPEFQFAGVTHQVVHQDGQGTRALLAYQREVAERLRRSSAGAVVLLGAQLAGMAGRLGGRPTALYWNEHPTHTFHGGRWGAVSRWLNRALAARSFAAARRADLVMPIGEAHEEDLLQHGIARRRCRLIYMGVDARFVSLGAAERPARPAGPLELIYTGTVEAARGRDVMLEGLSLALRNGVPCRLTIVGASDEQLAYCTRRSRELGTDSALTVVGRIPGREIPAYLQRADLGICLWEDRIWWRFNPPTKLFEYLAAGLPVMASDIRTHTRYVRDGENGFVFDYSAAGFAAVIERAAAARAGLRGLSRAAARAGARFAWTGLEEGFIVAVEQLARGDVGGGIESQEASCSEI